MNEVQYPRRPTAMQAGSEVTLISVVSPFQLPTALQVPENSVRCTDPFCSLDLQNRDETHSQTQYFFLHHWLGGFCNLLLDLLLSRQSPLQVLGQGEEVQIAPAGSQASILWRYFRAVEMPLHAVQNFCTTAHTRTPLSVVKMHYGPLLPKKYLSAHLASKEKLCVQTVRTWRHHPMQAITRIASRLLQEGWSIDGRLCRTGAATPQSMRYISEFGVLVFCAGPSHCLCLCQWSVTGRVSGGGESITTTYHLNPPPFAPLSPSPHHLWPSTRLNSPLSSCSLISVLLSFAHRCLHQPSVFLCVRAHKEAFVRGSFLLHFLASDPARFHTPTTCCAPSNWTALILYSQRYIKLYIYLVSGLRVRSAATVICGIIVALDSSDP